jgi:zinc transport system ATP-binding protein
MPQPILSVENLSFAYSGFPVLKDVSFSIEEGEFVGFIGPNGGGKTTLFKLILGFLKQQQGKIYINGKLAQTSSNLVAYVPQSLRFDKQFPISVDEVVQGGLLKDLPWYGHFFCSHNKAVDDALKKVGMLDFKSRPFGTLSLGQAQRVLIARALVSKPKILLLDEPTASVDAQSEADIHQILFKLRGEITLLMVTHDLKAIIQDVQRVLCVQGGVISLKPEEVCEHFAMGVYHTPLVKSSFNKETT